MKILLAGQNGLIGSEIFKKLQRLHDVQTLSRNEKSDVRVDLNRALDIEKQTYGCYNAFIHCAGITDEDFHENPSLAFQRSTNNHSILIDKLIENGTEIFIYMSTAHVYGSFENVVNEDHPVNPLSDYAIAHYAAEQLLRRSTKEYNIKAFVLRPMAVFGIPQSMNSFKRWQLIPFSFPKNCIENQSIVLKSSGSQKRNFISTLDIAEYVNKILMNHELFGKYSVINPLGIDVMSVLQFAKKCGAIYEKQFNEKCTIIHPPPKDDKSGEELFQYSSHYDIHKSTNGLDDYINSFYTTQKTNIVNG